MRDHNRRHQPTDVNRNSTEGDGPEDPRNQKRKFNEAIVKVLSSSSPSKKLKSLYGVFFGFDTPTDTSFFMTTGKVGTSGVSIARLTQSLDSSDHS